MKIVACVALWMFCVLVPSTWASPDIQDLPDEVLLCIVKAVLGAPYFVLPERHKLQEEWGKALPFYTLEQRKETVALQKTCKKFYSLLQDKSLGWVDERPFFHTLRCLHTYGLPSFPLYFELNPEQDRLMAPGEQDCFSSIRTIRTYREQRDALQKQGATEEEIDAKKHEMNRLLGDDGDAWMDRVISIQSSVFGLPHWGSSHPFQNLKRVVLRGNMRVGDVEDFLRRVETLVWAPLCTESSASVTLFGVGHIQQFSASLAQRSPKLQAVVVGVKIVSADEVFILEGSCMPYVKFLSWEGGSSPKVEGHPGVQRLRVSGLKMPLVVSRCPALGSVILQQEKGASGVHSFSSCPALTYIKIEGTSLDGLMLPKVEECPSLERVNVKCGAKIFAELAQAQLDSVMHQTSQLDFKLKVSDAEELENLRGQRCSLVKKMDCGVFMGPLPEEGISGFDNLRVLRIPLTFAGNPWRITECPHLKELQVDDRIWDDAPREPAPVLHENSLQGLHADLVILEETIFLKQFRLNMGRQSGTSHLLAKAMPKARSIDLFRTGGVVRVVDHPELNSLAIDQSKCWTFVKDCPQLCSLKIDLNNGPEGRLVFLDQLSEGVWPFDALHLEKALVRDPDLFDRLRVENIRHTYLLSEKGGQKIEELFTRLPWIKSCDYVDGRCDAVLEESGNVLKARHKSVDLSL